MTENNGAGIKNPEGWPTGKKAYKKVRVIRRKPGYVSDPTGAVVAGSDSMTTKSDIKEGDFVMGTTSEGVVHGVVEHIMTGGTLGIPGSSFAIETSEENPGMTIRLIQDGEQTELLLNIQFTDVVV